MSLRLPLAAALGAALLAGCAAPSPEAAPSLSSVAEVQAPIVGTGTLAWDRSEIATIPAPPVPVTPTPPPAAPSTPPAEAAPDRPEPAPVPVQSAQQWVASVLAAHGVPEPVAPQIVPVLSCLGADAYGCAGYYLSNGVFVGPAWVQIRADRIGTGAGVFTVLHEYAHEQGITVECKADAYAIAHGADPAYATYGAC